jgi:hypothetical protein
MEKRKLESDAKLIKALFGFEPLDWVRKDNGDLIYLNQAGQKYTLTPQEQDKLTNKVLAGKEKEQKKPTPIPDPKPVLKKGSISD